MTSQPHGFNESEHPRSGDGRFAIKPVAEADIDSLIVAGEPAVERVQNVLRDAIERGELAGQVYIEYDRHDRPYAEFTDNSGVRYAVEATDSMIWVDATDDPETLSTTSVAGGWEDTVRQLPAAVAKAQTRLHDRRAFNELSRQWVESGNVDPSQAKHDERLGELVLNASRPEQRLSLREFIAADPEHDGRPTARVRIGGGNTDADNDDAFDCLVVAGPLSHPDETRVYVDERPAALPGWQRNAALGEAARRMGGAHSGIVQSFLVTAAEQSTKTRTTSVEELKESLA